MAFSVFVESINLRVSAKRRVEVVKLHEPY
jgi:hypothetical protein